MIHKTCAPGFDTERERDPSKIWDTYFVVGGFSDTSAFSSMLGMIGSDEYLHLCPCDRDTHPPKTGRHGVPCRVFFLAGSGRCSWQVLMWVGSNLMTGRQGSIAQKRAYNGDKLGYIHRLDIPWMYDI